MPSKGKKEKILLVDGYNVLNAQLPGLIGRSIEDAREGLIRMLHDYAGYSGQKVILVFDAWQSDRMKRTMEEKDDSFSIVFTQHNETADHYIERTCNEYAAKAYLGKIELRVATSDFVEQTIVMGRGAVRMSSRELLTEIDQMKRESRKAADSPKNSRTLVMDHLSDDVRLKLEKMRKGIE